MKAIIILFMLTLAQTGFAQSNGNGNGHHPNDGHPNTHPHHQNDPPEPGNDPETPSVPVKNTILSIMVFAGISILVIRKNANR